MVSSKFPTSLLIVKHPANSCDSAPTAFRHVRAVHTAVTSALTLSCAGLCGSFSVFNMCITNIIRMSLSPYRSSNSLQASSGFVTPFVSILSSVGSLLMSWDSFSPCPGRTFPCPLAIDPKLAWREPYGACCHGFVPSPSPFATVSCCFKTKS